MFRRAITRSFSTEAALNNPVFYRMRDNIKTLVFVAEHKDEVPIKIASQIGESLMDDLHTLTQGSQEKTFPKPPQPAQVNQEKTGSSNFVQVKPTLSPTFVEMERKLEFHASEIQKLREELALANEERKRDAAEVLIRKMQEDSQRLTEAISFIKMGVGWCIVANIANVLIS